MYLPFLALLAFSPFVQADPKVQANHTEITLKPSRTTPFEARGTQPDFDEYLEKSNGVLAWHTPEPQVIITREISPHGAVIGKHFLTPTPRPTPRTVLPTCSAMTTVSNPSSRPTAEPGARAFHYKSGLMEPGVADIELSPQTTILIVIQKSQQVATTAEHARPQERTFFVPQRTAMVARPTLTFHGKPHRAGASPGAIRAALEIAPKTIAHL